MQDISTSHVKSSRGSLLPLTVTRSIILNYYWQVGVRMSTNYPEIKRGAPNCLVAASSLEAILTLGDKYEASIL